MPDQVTGGGFHRIVLDGRKTLPVSGDNGKTRALQERGS
jgi:hypothetical protein